MSSDDYKEQRRNRQKELARKYIMSDEVDQVALEELNRLCKPIYLYIYSGYHIKLPHIDKDDYILMGYITLWKVLERCRKNPDILNNFSAYLFRSIRNAYAAEFRKYVFKNPIVMKDYEYDRAGYEYNIAHTVMLTKYKERVLQYEREWKRDFRRRNPELVRRREREYWHRNRDKKALKDKRYYIRHREQIREYGKRYRAEHKEEIREKKRKYAQENREKINAYKRQYWHEHLEEKRAYHREYGRRYRQEHLEHCRARDREQNRRYRQEHPEKVKQWKRAEYLRQKTKIAAMDPETYRRYREKENARYRKYRQKNREKINARQREYRKRKKAEAAAKLKEQERISMDAVQNQAENKIESE